MNKLQLACYSLMASAFVLAGLLAVNLPNHLPQAQGAMVIRSNDYTFMTTRTDQNEEALFVIDSINERLLIYRTEIIGNSGRVRLAASEDWHASSAKVGAGGRVVCRRGRETEQAHS